MEITVRTKAYDDRRKDLAMLEAVLNNPDKPKSTKQAVQASKKSILLQLQDKTLLALRHRLVKAVLAGNERAQWKISNQLKAYMGEEQLIAPTN